jgi:predicted esterase
MEEFGGFDKTPFDEDVQYHSPLGTNGIAKWSIVPDESISCNSSHECDASIQLNAAFPSIHWTSLQSIYGWAALQYQAFARGYVRVSGRSSCRVKLYTDNVLELAVNCEPHFGGDFYGFRRAPLILNLRPGENKIDLRLIRDVRSMGGVGSPSIPIRLDVKRCTAIIDVDVESAIFPDIVDGRLVSPLASVIVRNQAEAWIDIIDVRICDPSTAGSTCGHRYTSLTQALSGVRLLRPSPVSLAPGQSRTISFYFEEEEVDLASKALDLAFAYQIAQRGSLETTDCFRLTFCTRSIYDAQKFTFLHPSGAVSYAIIRPPSSKVSGSILPVLLNLHGAGLEADSHQVRHLLDAVPDLEAWVLYPTGMSPWSGDDWHVWGIADVKAAVAAIPDWIRNVRWAGPPVDLEKWVVTGHSNGGQGVWYIATHEADKVVALAAISGYTSIQNYVPYVMWREGDPLIHANIQNSLSSYRHELLLENVSGIPVYQQHGAVDDNVPPFHSRLMSSLLAESGHPSRYVELTDRGHWFDGAMTTKPLQNFYSSVLGSSGFKKQIPVNFSFVTPESGDFGSRAGISIDQLQSPDVPGRIDVHRDDENHIWHIKTSNVHRMHLNFPVESVPQPATLIVDESANRFPLEHADMVELALVQYDDSCWRLSNLESWKSSKTRYGRQRGGLSAILRTSSPFKVQISSDEVSEAALEVSRNLMQYYGADTELIMFRNNSFPSNGGNAITLVVGRAVNAAEVSGFPIEVTQHDVLIWRKHSYRPKRIPIMPGLGVAFIRPRPAECLELVLWGSDIAGLRQAIRMVPTLTGVGQPDFVILSDSARWKGPAAVLAMGFFDHAWQISQASYVP